MYRSSDDYILSYTFAFLCRKFAPDAAGNGMGKVKNSIKVVEHTPINYNRLFSYLSLRVLVVKCASSLLCAFAGGAMGREGPAVHMSTAFFMVVGNKFKSFLPRVSPEVWVFTGSAVGLVVAFHAPLSGIIFVLEKSIKLKSYKYHNFTTWISNKLLKAQSPNFIKTLIWSIVALAVYLWIGKSGQMFASESFALVLSPSLL
ncbi:MAG: hypothetical protein HON23_05190 [Rickettsiales bacterium]|nr:hypothetical protein [Rickettsiales bacterium]